MSLSKYIKSPTLIVEKGEYVKDTDNNVFKVSPNMPTHDDNTLVGITKDKKVSKGKGGIELENIVEVVSATQENRRQKDSTYSIVDESIKFNKDEAKAFIKQKFLLNPNIKGSSSPAKLIDLTLDAKKKFVSKFKNKIVKPGDKFNEQSILANKAQLAALPELNDIFDAVFAEQESKKIPIEQSNAQVGISKEQLARNKAFKTIRPSDETDIKNYTRWLTNTPREEWDDVVSEEAWSVYTNQNKPLKYLRESNNSNPTWEKEHKGKKMYRLHDAFEEDLKYTYFDKLKVGEQRLVNEEELKSRDFKPVNLLGSNDEDSDNIMKSRARVLRQYTINKKKDEKGKEYLEYRDIYDLPNIFQDRIKGIPFGIMGRVYQQGGKTKLKPYPYMKGSRPALGTTSGKSIESLDGRSISMDQIYDSDSVKVDGTKGTTFYKSKLKKYIKKAN